MSGKQKCIPRVERISQWGSATELIYNCRKCGASLAILGSQENFCHNCGAKLLWKNVPTNVTDKFAIEYYGSDFERKKRLMDALDAEIAKIN